MKTAIAQLIRKVLAVLMTMTLLVSLSFSTLNVKAEEPIEEFYFEEIVPNDAGNVGDVYLPVPRQIINTLRNGMLTRQETISVTVPFETGFDYQNFVMGAAHAAMEHNGNPKEGDYLFFTYGGFSASTSMTFTSITTNYNINFYTTAAQEQAVDSAVASLINSLNLNSKSTYNQIKSVYDWIVSNVKYVDNGTDIVHSCYGALVNKKAVCQGYALLFYRMMMEMGIDCRIIVSSTHAWNIVKIGEKYYHVDSTWGATTGNPSAYFLKGSSMTGISQHDPSPEYKQTAFKSEYPVSSADYKPTSADYGGAASVKTVRMDQTWIDMKPFDSEKLNATQSVVWSSTKPEVASVDSSGNVSAKNKGVAYIIAKNQATGKLARCTVVVSDCDLPDSFIRISGADRFTTGVMTKDEELFLRGGEQFDAVVLTSGLNYADALAGSYLAYVKKAPILITAESFGDISRVYSSVNQQIRSSLKEGGTVYVLGGPAAVSDKSINGLDKSFDVVRLSGKNRYETNLAILEEAGVTDEDILVCTGNNYADSLSGSSAKRPILLVSENGLSDAQREYLDTLEEYDNQFYIIGGQAAVSADTENQIAEYGTTERISGKTRFETSVKMAETLYENPDQVVLAYSHNFPDGLCGGPLAAQINAPIILTSNGNESAAAAYCQANGITRGYVLGGTGLISNYTVRVISGQ